jgi:hypothetical protein
MVVVVVVMMMMIIRMKRNVAECTKSPVARIASHRSTIDPNHGVIKDAEANEDGRCRW